MLCPNTYRRPWKCSIRKLDLVSLEFQLFNRICFRHLCQSELKERGKVGWRRRETCSASSYSVFFFNINCDVVVYTQALSKRTRTTYTPPFLPRTHTHTRLRTRRSRTRAGEKSAFDNLFSSLTRVEFKRPHYMIPLETSTYNREQNDSQEHYENYTPLT